MRYRHSYEIRRRDAGRDECLTPDALYDYLQETAILHSDSVDLGANSLARHGLAWILNRVIIHVDRYPRRREMVTIETWANNLRGLYAIREWRASDEAGAAFARATSRWFLINIEKRKPARIPGFITEAYGEIPEDRAIADSFDRVSPIETAETTKLFHVRLSDLDTNQHANSSRYIDWAIEAVPAEILYACKPSAIDISYKQEGLLGDEILSLSARTAIEGDDPAFDHVIRRTGGGEVLAMGRTHWRRAAEFGL